jgi:hypothetical protein
MGNYRGAKSCIVVHTALPQDPSHHNWPQFRPVSFFPIGKEWVLEGLLWHSGPNPASSDYLGQRKTSITRSHNDIKSVERRKGVCVSWALKFIVVDKVGGPKRFLSSRDNRHGCFLVREQTCRPVGRVIKLEILIRRYYRIHPFTRIPNTYKSPLEEFSRPNTAVIRCSTTTQAVPTSIRTTIEKGRCDRQH